MNFATLLLCLCLFLECSAQDGTQDETNDNTESTPNEQQFAEWDTTKLPVSFSTYDTLQQPQKIEPKNPPVYSNEWNPMVVSIGFRSPFRRQLSQNNEDSSRFHPVFLMRPESNRPAQIIPTAQYPKPSIAVRNPVLPALSFSHAYEQSLDSQYNAATQDSGNLSIPQPGSFVYGKPNLRDDVQQDSGNRNSPFYWLNDPASRNSEDVITALPNLSPVFYIPHSQPLSRQGNNFPFPRANAYSASTHPDPDSESQTLQRFSSSSPDIERIPPEEFPVADAGPPEPLPSNQLNFPLPLDALAFGFLPPALLPLGPLSDAHVAPGFFPNVPRISQDSQDDQNFLSGILPQHSVQEYPELIDSLPADGGQEENLPSQIDEEPADDQSNPVPPGDGLKISRIPYEFGFDTYDGNGTLQYRKEISDESGVVRGSYGYEDPSGVYRVVTYYADETGFHASVRSNEPGLSNVGSADVVVTAELPPPHALEEGMQQTEESINASPEKDESTESSEESQEK